jgi:uncharacterized protein
LVESTQSRPAFRARRFLSGGHRQTLASFFLQRRLALPPSEEKLIEVEPDVRVLCHCHWQKDPSQALTVVVVHGLEGSSDSAYARGIAVKGFKAGMNVVRMNQRNCGGTDTLAPTLYHSGRSQDVARVASALIEEKKLARIALVGFSMGGNLVLKLAGEWGKGAPKQLKTVVGVCPAVDLGPSADALHRPINRVYEYYFLWKLRQRLRCKAKFFPGQFDVKRARGVRTLREFDDKVTAYYCGFAGAEDYYQRSSASRVIENISVPTLILHAANDPFIRILPDTRAKISANSHITFHETQDGGHCSFLGERDGYDGHWAEREVLEFVAQGSS